MKNLIEEIEKLKRIEVECVLDEVCNKLINKGLDDVINLLNQYNTINIITAPKRILLSEIVERLKESNEYLDFEIETTLDFKKAIGVNYKSYDGEYYFDECVVFNENMTIERVCLESTKYKWLYTLWIAETTVIDDLKEKEND